MSNVAADAAEKTTELIYGLITVLLIMAAIIQSMLIPLYGGMQAFSYLLILTLKAAIGYLRETSEKKITGDETANDEPPEESEDEETRAKQIANYAKQKALKEAKKIAMQTAKAATKSATRSSVYGLIVDYLTSPMSRIELYMLGLGWILFPVAVTVPFVVLLNAFRYGCQQTLLGDYICKYFPDLIPTLITP